MFAGDDVGGQSQSDSSSNYSSSDEESVDSGTCSYKLNSIEEKD